VACTAAGAISNLKVVPVISSGAAWAAPEISSALPSKERARVTHFLVKLLCCAVLCIFVPFVKK
jgi:hypothetical protein